MTVTEAAKRWEAAKRKSLEAKAELEVSEPVLKQWFADHPDSRDYRSRIGISIVSRLILDQTAVKTFLGKRLEKFQKRVTSQSLSLLK